MTLLLLLLSAMAGGAVNAIAGGGTLLTFPSLLTVITPVFATATSTTALLPGSLASAWGYREELARVKHHLVRLLPPSFAGGLLGSLLVVRLPETVFATAVPWLLVGASILLLVQKPVARWIGAHPHKEATGRTLAGVIVFQFLVGVYGGYFAAGIGILMLSSLAFVGISDIHEMNAVKNILAGAMNAISVLIFVISGVIVWKYAILMAITAIIGGYAGARVARRMNRELVRAIVVAVGFFVAVWSYMNL